MIASDWHLARVVMQILMEERTGRNVRAEMGAEDEQFAEASRKLQDRG